MKNILIIVSVTLLISGLSFYGGLFIAASQNNETTKMLNKIYATQGVESEINEINIHLFYMNEIDKQNNPELVKKARHFVKLSLNHVRGLLSIDLLKRPMINSAIERAQKFVDEEK